jgi:hypothetical protein
MFAMNFVCDQLTLEEVIRRNSSFPGLLNNDEIKKMGSISKETKQYFEYLIEPYNKFAMIKHILEKGKANIKETVSFMGPIYVKLGGDLAILHFANYPIPNTEDANRMRDETFIKIKTLQDDIDRLNNEYSEMNYTDNAFMFLLCMMKETKKLMNQYIKNAFNNFFN